MPPRRAPADRGPVSSRTRNRHPVARRLVPLPAGRLPRPIRPQPPFITDYQMGLGNLTETAVLRLSPSAGTIGGFLGYFRRWRPFAYQALDRLLRDLGYSIRVRAILQTSMYHPETDGTVPDILLRLVTDFLDLTRIRDIDAILDRIEAQWQAKFDTAFGTQSGLVLRSLTDCTLIAVQNRVHPLLRSQVRALRPVGAGSYLPLPGWLDKKWGLVNPRNADPYCLLYCLAMAVRERDDAAAFDRVRDKGNPAEYDLDRDVRSRLRLDHPEIGYPFHPTMFGQLERLNRPRYPGLRFLALVADSEAETERSLTIAHLTPAEKRGPETDPDEWLIPLLWISQMDDNGVYRSHWVYVRKLDALLSTDRTRHHYHCTHCLRGFTRQNALATHLSAFGCEGKAAIRTVTPRPDDAFATFHAYRKTQWGHRVVYADFESLLIGRRPDETSRIVQQEHVPCGFSAIMIGGEPGREQHVIRETAWTVPESGDPEDRDSAGKALVRCLQRLLARALEWDLAHYRPACRRLEAHEITAGFAAPACVICGLPFSPLTQHRSWIRLTKSEKLRGRTPESKLEAMQRRVDHFAEFDPGDNYRGQAHLGCHLQTRTAFRWVKPRGGGPRQIVGYGRSVTIPVVFHNFRHYDCHAIIRALQNGGPCRITTIPQQGESMLSVTYGHFRFIDSYAFLPQSLAKLAATLTRSGRDPDACPQTRAIAERWCERYGVEYGPDAVSLLCQKGVFPYDHMDGWDRFDETGLPPRERFYSRMDEEELTEDDYARAVRVWGRFGCRTMLDYHNLYLETDVALLADVFERFRAVSHADCGLDPAQYLSLPQFSRDMGFKLNGWETDAAGWHRPFEVQLFEDIPAHDNMYLMCEDGIRGGISMVPNRHAVAGPGRTLVDNDMVNLYGAAMREPMPFADFRWAEPDEFAAILGRLLDPVSPHPPDATYGFTLCVDLVVPDCEHDRLRDYPPAPERRPIRESEIPPFLRARMMAAGVRVDEETPRLLCTLGPKRRYVVHYRNLQWYVTGLGLRVTKVHHVLVYRQRPWIRGYVDHHTRARAAATARGDKMAEAYHKFMLNSFFGKMAQNDREHRRVELVTDPERLRRLIRSPFFAALEQISGECTQVEMLQRRVNLNKPIATGQAILDLSKLLMSTFYYQVVKTTWPADRSRLLMTDTDSVLLDLETDDWVRDVKAAGHDARYDWSNYPADHPTFCGDRRKKPGTMQDVMAGKRIHEVICKASKMYAIRHEADGDGAVETIRAKGLRRSLVPKRLPFRIWRRTIDEPEYRPDPLTMRGFQSRGHTIYTMQIDKRTLPDFDLKLIQTPGGVRTYPYGHYRARDEIAQGRDPA